VGLPQNGFELSLRLNRLAWSRITGKDQEGWPPTEKVWKILGILYWSGKSGWNVCVVLSCIFLMDSDYRMKMTFNLIQTTDRKDLAGLLLLAKIRLDNIWKRSCLVRTSEYSVIGELPKLCQNITIFMQGHVLIADWSVAQRPPCCHSWRHSWWQRSGQHTNQLSGRGLAWIL